jgi:lysine/ornithine N-monooxygenase
MNEYSVLSEQLLTRDVFSPTYRLFKIGKRSVKAEVVIYYKVLTYRTLKEIMSVIYPCAT